MGAKRSATSVGSAARMVTATCWGAAPCSGAPSMTAQEPLAVGRRA